MLAVVRLCSGQNCWLWRDSTYVSDGVQSILRGEPDMDGDNWDLWEGMCVPIQGLPQRAIGATHIPSHLDEQQCESVFEDCVARWNSHVDRQADLANQGRPQSFVDLHGRAMEFNVLNSRRIRQLRKVYHHIAERTEGRRVPEFMKLMRQAFRMPACRTSWRPFWSWTVEGICTSVSWVEFVFCLKVQRFQFWHRPNGRWAPVGDSLHAPNLARLAFFVRRAITVLVSSEILDSPTVWLMVWMLLTWELFLFRVGSVWG